MTEQNRMISNRELNHTRKRHGIFFFFGKGCLKLLSLQDTSGFKDQRGFGLWLPCSCFCYLCQNFNGRRLWLLIGLSLMIPSPLFRGHEKDYSLGFSFSSTSSLTNNKLLPSKKNKNNNAVL